VAATATFIVDLFEQHLDELGFLHGQWRRALQDPDYPLKALGDLEERIRAHLQGVQVPGDKAWPRLLEALDGDDADLVFAAAFALLHCGQPELTGKVLGAFAIVEEEPFAAIAAALSHAPVSPEALEQIRSMLSARPAAHAVAAAEVLAFHDALQLTGDQLRWFVEDEDAAVRRDGWRLAALLGAALPPQAYAAALRDDDQTVADAALHAGAWAGAPGVLSALRHLLDRPATPEQLGALHLLAVVGGPEDLPRLERALDTAELGPLRMHLAASAGSPALVSQLLAAMDDPDPATAAAAGTTFTRLTNLDVESGRREPVAPPGDSPPDEFDAEFQDEVMLPDAAKARCEWERLQPQLGLLPSICRGVDAAEILQPGYATTLDMLSRHELHLRARFTGSWKGTLLVLERFPQVAAAAAPAAPERLGRGAPAPLMQRNRRTAL
jgi:uncharacterized protein (TIGR02270 family)